MDEGSRKPKTTKEGGLNMGGNDSSLSNNQIDGIRKTPCRFRASYPSEWQCMVDEQKPRSKTLENIFFPCANPRTRLRRMNSEWVALGYLYQIERLG